MSILSDPLNWARKAAGTKHRLIVSILTHAMIVMIWIGIFEIPKSLYFPIVFLGIIVPGIYLYGLFNCLKVIDQKKLVIFNDKVSFIIGYVTGTGAIISLAIIAGFRITAIKSLLGILVLSNIIGVVLGLMSMSDPKKKLQE